MTKQSKDIVSNLPLDKIDEPKDILRFNIDPQELAELAQSIHEIGLLQPILVAIDGDRFELVFGHRRFLACKSLELREIRAIIRTMNREEIGIARATENINRADLTPLEEAQTYSNLLLIYGFTVDQVAKKMGRSGGTVKRRLDLLKMPKQLQNAVHSKRISITVAEELWPIADLTDLDYYLSFAIDGGCTKEVARGWAKDWKDKIRRQQHAGGDALPDLAPSQPRPVFVACDLCSGPMEIGQETVFRLCPDCTKTLVKNI